MHSARAQRHRHARREEGQTLVECALLLLLVAAVIVGVVATVGTRVKSLFSNVASST